MFGRHEADDANHDADAARRRRNRRRLAFGTAAVVVGSAGVAFLLLRKGGAAGVADVVDDGLSRSPSPQEFQHFVSGHDRTLSSGATVPVRSYLRGPRDTPIRTIALIDPDRLPLITRDSAAVQLEIPEAFLAAA